MTTRTDRIQVIFEVGGDGKLKATLGDLGREGEKAAQGLDKASAAKQRMQVAAVRAAAAIGGAMVSTLSLVIANTIEAEKVDAQLEARLRSTAGVAGMTKQALDDLAAATARKTTFDDEAIKSAESMLLTFTKISSQVFPQAIDAITDMSVALGTDLQSATIAVGKALQDPEQGILNLTRAGVQFSDEQKELIKTLMDTGQQAEAQAVILRELETQFGGAAEAARDTLGGALVALKNTLMDLTEGGAGSLDGATQAVEDFNDALNDPQTREGIAALVGGLFDLMGIVAKVPAGFALMGKFIGVTLAEIQNQAAQTAVIMRNISTLGMADGTIAGALKQQSAGRENYQRALDDMVLGNHGMTRSGYTQQFQSQFNLGLPGSATTQVLGAGSSGGFNFAADQASRSASSRTSARAPTGGGASRGGASGGSRASAPRAMPDFGDDDLRDLQRLIEETARADEQFGRLAATLGGPLAEAQYEHQQNLREIETLGKAAGRTSEEIIRLKDEETARYKEEAAAIAERQNPAAQLLRDLEFELQLLGMTNAERATAIDLRRLEGRATAEQAAQIRAGHEALEASMRTQQDITGAMDGARGGIQEFLDSMREGEGLWSSLTDGANAFADTLWQIASRKLIEQILGGYGTSGGSGGGLGDIFGSLLGALFGGGSASTGSSGGGGGQFSWAGAGYARGGYTGMGGPSEPAGIVHRGEYVMDAGTVDRFGPAFFDRLRSGQMPMAAASGPQDFSTHIHVRGDISQRTARHLANERSEFMARQARRG